MLTKRGIIILANMVLVLVFFNLSVMDKEEILEEGELVLLELAPVDPRSLMQGDYMRLNYAISQVEDLKTMENKGYAVVQLDSQQVAQLVRYQSGMEPLKEGEHLLKYHKGEWTLNLGAESYFFEEGQADNYEKAEYGGLKVDANGNSILVGLYDSEQRLIMPKRDKRE